MTRYCALESATVAAAAVFLALAATPLAARAQGLVAGAGATSAVASGFDHVSSRRLDADTLVWRIERPNVTQSTTVYRGIQIADNDRVILNAGGCVQTGGAGQTWKRYVDPRGPDAGRLYHGLVSLPHGADLSESGRSAMAPLASVIGRELPGRSFAAGCASCDTAGAPRAALVLGYQDDNYGDNGYYSHDDGTDNQCRDEGPAWVTVTIRQSPSAQARAASVPGAGSPAGAPADSAAAGRGGGESAPLRGAPPSGDEPTVAAPGQRARTHPTIVATPPTRATTIATPPAAPPTTIATPPP
jgi:hypothetical protein